MEFFSSPEKQLVLLEVTENMRMEQTNIVNVTTCGKLEFWKYFMLWNLDTVG